MQVKINQSISILDFLSLPIKFPNLRNVLRILCFHKFFLSIIILRLNKKNILNNTSIKIFYLF
ncbi:hypothetical protein CP02DC14_0891 [Chlamydia psittaci 02DC14]|nr:hypothetical protein CP02DC14_0891 [Chlamydia psittaci 02DC14]